MANILFVALRQRHRPHNHGHEWLALRQGHHICPNGLELSIVRAKAPFAPAAALLVQLGTTIPKVFQVLRPH